MKEGKTAGLFFETLIVVVFFSTHSAVTVVAQQELRFSLTGSVRNAEIHDPLPGATIRLLGTTLGTATNSDGRYRLLLAPGSYQILVNYVGFNSRTVSVEITSHDTTLDVSLSQSAVALSEVVVYPFSTNPADEIIQRAIRTKRIWSSRLHSFEFDAYTKTVIRVVIKKEKVDTVISGILETQTKAYSQAPDSYLEVVTARRQTANFTPAQNIFTPGRVLNFSDDVVKIDRYSIVGPIAPSALEYYDYNIVDTIYQRDTRIYRIAVEPKTKFVPLFRGYIDIAEGSYALIHVDLGLSNSSTLGPIEEIRYDEQFALYNEEFWLPIEVKTAFALKFNVPPIPPVLFDNVSVLYNYTINKTFPPDFFDGKFVSVSQAKQESDSAAWQKEQVLPLTHLESSAYTRIDSIVNHMTFFQRAFLFLTRVPYESQSWPLTDFSDFFHYNRVEGAYTGVGLTTQSIFPQTELTVVGGYGFSDRRWKYDLSARYNLPFAHGLSVGARILRKVTSREEESIYSPFEITIGTLFSKADYRDYYFTRGWRAFIRQRFSALIEGTAEYADELQTSVSRNTNYSIFSRDQPFRENPPINDGTLRSVTVSLNLDSRKYFDTGMSMVSDEGSDYWIGNASGEVSSSRFLSSSFSFTSWRASLFTHQMTFAAGYLNLSLTGRTSNGQLPIQRMFEIQTSYGGYAEQGAMFTVGQHLVISRELMIAGVEHDFASNLFKWSNIPLVKDVWFDLSLFANAAATKGFVPMAESGFALVNIIPFISTDFAWGFAGACKGFVFTVETSVSF